MAEVAKIIPAAPTGKRSVKIGDNSVSPEQLKQYYRDMILIRRFEERAGQLYGMGLIGGFCHLYIGQEAVVVGMQSTITQKDSVLTSYRDHGHMLACGMDPRGVMAELTGRSGGYSKGKGGSMHMFSREKNFYGGHGIVGAQVPIGTGLAFAQKYKGGNEVTLTYFGDGSANQGQVYEAMNMAALWKLPVIYVCENNLYNEYTHNSETIAGDMLTRAAGFGIEGKSVDGQDVRAVYATAKEIVERVRSGNGPAFLVCQTYRFLGHHVGDVSREYYRSKQEEQMWKTQRDPITLFGDFLLKEKLADRAQLDSIQKEVKAEVDRAVQFATAAPYPSPDKVDQDVYA